ncbi:hypothetical protein KCP77_07480 [Salmonella enterica subsp. enterica]|nr:hypothetical protein KCP77_07480 [Salmonella enterica subsp. enterica]
MPCWNLRTGLGLVAVCDEQICCERRLTDGDLRRWLVAARAHHAGKRSHDAQRCYARVRKAAPLTPKRS